MNGISIKDPQTKSTCGTVTIGPDGTVRLAGFSEELGKVTKNPGGTWAVELPDGGTGLQATRQRALYLLWLARENRLHAAGR